MPVIDLSGVWTATVPARHYNVTPTPVVLYTLTLGLTGSTVTPNGTGVDLSYDADLVIDGYRGFDLTPEIATDLDDP